MTQTGPTSPTTDDGDVEESTKESQSAEVTATLAARRKRKNSTGDESQSRPAS